VCVSAFSITKCWCKVFRHQPRVPDQVRDEQHLGVSTAVSPNPNGIPLGSANKMNFADLAKQVEWRTIWDSPISDYPAQSALLIYALINIFLYSNKIKFGQYILIQLSFIPIANPNQGIRGTLATAKSQQLWHPNHLKERCFT